jgi:hypothetical protein
MLSPDTASHIAIQRNRGDRLSLAVDRVLKRCHITANPTARRDRIVSNGASAASAAFWINVCIIFVNLGDFFQGFSRVYRSKRGNVAPDAATGAKKR